jgi:methionine-rich copper-binding protein CopC
MIASRLQRRSTCRHGRHLAFRLQVETLETRSLPSVTTWPGLLHPIAESASNHTLDQAQNLGDLSSTPRAEVVGSLTNSPSGGGVDWYSFTLDSASSVTISTPPARPNAPPVTTISLYNSDPNDANDPYDPLGHRLLDQVDSATQTGTAQIQRRLAPGTYYVAISGSGNDYFNPFLADSGYPGATGNYGLLITAADLGLKPTDGPAVLATDPQAGAALQSSPFLIRVDVSEPVDPHTLSAGGSVQLISNVNGTFGDGNDQPVSLASVNLNTAGNELLIAPAAPLAPSYYEVVLAGNTSSNAPVVADLNGTPLGATSSEPNGADFTYTFQVTGNEGHPGNTPDDTPATSRSLGDITKAGLVQIAGAIGVDSTDPIPFDGSQVDLYHFQLTGTGHYAFTAEVFAGRIGSPLYAGVSLFEADPNTGQLSLISSNAGSQNTTVATNGTQPLFSDPVLYAALGAGDYYLAVTNNFNIPDPVNSPPGTNGVFNPAISHSGQNGGSTGNYALNLYAQSIPNPPTVVAATPANGTTVNAPPTILSVRFSEPVNLQELAFQATVQGAYTLPQVFVEGSDGTKYYPELLSYATATNEATFQMNAALGNGSYQLHLSGPLGLADMAGNPLVGNDPSGDYLVNFTVQGPVRGTGSNPDLWMDQEPNNDPAHAQDLGVLFCQDFETGVTLQRNAATDPANAPSDTEDNYRFQVLQVNNYVFNLPSADLPSGAHMELLDSTGTPINVAPQPTGLGFSAILKPGTYVLQIGGWTPAEAASVSYTIVMKQLGTFDNPVPLTAGPGPAISIQPVSTAPPSAPPAPVAVNPPSPPTTPSSTPPPPAVATGPTDPPAGPVATTLPPADPLSASPIAPATVASGTMGIMPSPGGTMGPGTSAPVATNSPPPATSPSLPTSATEVPTATLASTAPAGTALPSHSVVTVTLTAPTTVSSSGITPALLRTTSDRSVDPINLPSGTLLALGTSPVGGIKDPATATDSNPPPERVFVQLPSASSPTQLHLALDLNSKADSGTATAELPAASSLPTVESNGADGAILFQSTPGTPPSSIKTDPSTLPQWFSQSIHHLLDSSSKSTLDVLFGMMQQLGEMTMQPITLPQEVSSGGESVDYEDSDIRFLRTQAGAENTQPVRVDCLLVLASIAAVTSAEYHRSELKRKRDAQLWRNPRNQRC